MERDPKTNPFAWSRGPAIPTHREDPSVIGWQLMIDTGDVWHLPAWFGRTAAALIGAGICQPQEA